jgi:hypothetical protein
MTCVLFREKLPAVLEALGTSSGEVDLKEFGSVTSAEADTSAMNFKVLG